ncbi:MAG TPA: pyrroline-5-carboxylate reductase [Rhodocyclaceae bacterium]|nr:pyrroline-5-carboxylate reductase [Rhodocyclaceae bacterium]
MRITFIGGGNMASAMIGGLRRQGFSAAGLQVVEPNDAARARLTEAFGVRCAATVDAAAANSEVLVLAVKPQQMRAAVAPLTAYLDRQIVLSIAAGLRLVDLSRWLDGYRRIVRCMPNTPASIGAGVSGLYAAPEVDAIGCGYAEKAMQAVGGTVWLAREEDMDAVTAISGSGPAYVFYFMEAMMQTALDMGLSAEAAKKLTIDSFAGAALLAEHSTETIETLRKQVTSKGGTTEAALDAFDAHRVGAGIYQGVLAAQARGRELGELLGKE